MILRTPIDSIGDDAAAASMTPGTCRAARALLAISQTELAERAGISVQTLANFEKEQSVPSHGTWLKIKRALEKAGIQFLEENGGGGGLRLKAKSR